MIKVKSTKKFKQVNVEEEIKNTPLPKGFKWQKTKSSKPPSDAAKFDFQKKLLFAQNLPFTPTTIKPESILELLPPDLNKHEVRKYYFYRRMQVLNKIMNKDNLLKAQIKSNKNPIMNHQRMKVRIDNIIYESQYDIIKQEDSKNDKKQIEEEEAQTLLKKAVPVQTDRGVMAALKT